MQEICDLHGRLLANLRLGMSVFLHGDLASAQRLLAEKVLFRDLERAYAESHIERLTSNTVQSIETSSLHLDMISDLKRINSHICSIAYPDTRRGRRPGQDAAQGSRGDPMRGSRRRRTRFRPPRAIDEAL